MGLSTVSTGLDIVSISRLGRARRHPRFLPRVFTVEEIKHGARTSAPNLFYAKLFAVKEATAKALGTGIGRGFGFTDIEVIFHNRDNSSYWFNNTSLKLQNRAAVELGNRKAFLSCSTSGDLAVAYVLIE